MGNNIKSLAKYCFGGVVMRSEEEVGSVVRVIKNGGEKSGRIDKVDI